jgi:hypothetical protein
MNREFGNVTFPESRLHQLGLTDVRSLDVELPELPEVSTLPEGHLLGPRHRITPVTTNQA